MTDQSGDGGPGRTNPPEGTPRPSDPAPTPKSTGDVAILERRRIPGPRGGTLTPFPKGHVANPEGGRKQKQIRQAYDRLGKMTVAELEGLDTTRLTVFEMAAYRELERTLIAGNSMVAHAAMQEVSDRVDGKVAQKMLHGAGLSEELENLSDEELQERVRQLRERNG